MDGQRGVKSAPLQYDFHERLQMSQGASQSATVESVLLDNIPGAIAVNQASKADDKTGVDWFVRLRNGKNIGVDCKIRTQDYAERGQDDLALETWSVVENGKTGWTRDSDKRTDYVLWLWTDTGRWCLIPFHPLCAVFSEKWQDWKLKYKHSQQYTPWNGAGYHSECVFVPRTVVWRSIYEQFGGKARGMR